MGEVLRGPWADHGDRSVTEGARPAPSDRPGGPPAKSAGQPDNPPAVADLISIQPEPGPEPPPEPEAAWAIPGVDADEPVPIESPRHSKRAEHVAIVTLTRHDASEGEVRAKLLAKGLDEEEVDGELDRLRRCGLIDDAAFAARQVERLRERKGMGDGAIRSALRGRLVPQAVVDAVLADQVEDAETAEQRLQQAADDRARRLGPLPFEVAERRLVAYLMRKGYSGSAVRAAARAALEGPSVR